MDGVLSPVHRIRRKYVCCDLYSSAIGILIIETSIFSSWTIYHSLMLWSYYENEGKTTDDVISEENGLHVTKPLIPNDVMYYLLLLGFTFCLLLNFLLFLGTVWLFGEFLQLWTRGCVFSTVYLTLVLGVDWFFARYQFPFELIVLPFRFYFIFLINAFRKQIADDAEHDYDYKKFAEDHFRKTGTEFVAVSNEVPGRLDGFWRLLCAICGVAYRNSNKVAPANFSDRQTIIHNMYRDMDAESLDLAENPGSVEATEDIPMDPIEFPGGTGGFKL